MTGVSYEKDEEEVLSGVNMLQQELEFERSVNDGLSKRYEAMQIQQDSDNEVTTELRKRIVQLENELCKGLIKSNAKRSGEEALVTRLRTLLEKSEASRQQSEFSLLLEQKKSRELVGEMSEKERKFRNDMRKYSESLKEYQKRTHEWEKAIKLSEKAAGMEKENYEGSCNKLLALIAEKDGVIEYMNLEATENKKKISELSENLDTEKLAHAKCIETLRGSNAAMAQLKDALKQATLKQAVFEQKDRNNKKEQKDLVQERNQIEGQLQRERGLNIQNTQQFSSVEGQLIQLEEANKDLKVCLCHEKDMREKGQADLEDRKADCSKFQNEILSLQEKLTSIAGSTKKSEEELSQQLRDRDDHISRLQSEIQKHQTVCGEMSEELSSLQQAMQQIEHHYGKSIVSLERMYCQHFSGCTDSVSPLDMVNSIANKLRDSHTDIVKLETDNAALRRTIERNESVSEIQRRAIESKSDTIQTLQNQLREMSEQLNSVEEDGRIQGSNNSALQQQVQDMTSLLATEQEKALTLLKDKKEFIKQKHVHLKEQCETVRNICETLGDTTLGDKAEENDWAEVCQAASAAARRCTTEKRELANFLKEAQAEAASCHGAMVTLSKNVDDVRLECSRKLTESEVAHSKHTKALESNYMQLIDTLNTKLKVSDLNVKKTNEKIRGFYEENEELKEKVSSFEEDLLACEQRRVCFQAAVGMLGSQLLHHMNSFNRVLHVLAIYKQQVKQGQLLIEELTCLSDALSDSKSTQHPVFTFRKAVIAVLASNRFRTLGKEFKRNYMLGVPDGINPIAWLESEELDRLIWKPIKHWRSTPLANTTDRLVAVIYNNTTSICAEMYRDSLLHRIAQGQKSSRQSFSLPNPVVNVRTFVLHLTERLHSVETERRSLTTKVNHWQKEAKELKGAVEQTAILSRKVEELENVAFETVPILKHESVMKELASVLSREESLREESHSLRQQLKQLESSYDTTASQLRERSETLDEAIKELSEHKLHQRQSDIESRSCTRKVSSLESDKQNLSDNLQSLQKWTDAQSRDRDYLVSYLSKLQVALQERKIRVTSGNMSSTTGYISTDIISHQVEEVQKICALYEDIIKLTQRRISGVERDVESVKTHPLKGSCQRLDIEDIPLGRALVGMERNKDDTLVPLLHIPNTTSQSVGHTISDVMSWS